MDTSKFSVTKAIDALLPYVEVLSFKRFGECIERKFTETVHDRKYPFQIWRGGLTVPVSYTLQDRAYVFFVDYRVTVKEGGVLANVGEWKRIDLTHLILVRNDDGGTHLYPLVQRTQFPVRFVPGHHQFDSIKSEVLPIPVGYRHDDKFLSSVQPPADFERKFWLEVHEWFAQSMWVRREALEKLNDGRQGVQLTLRQWE